MSQREEGAADPAHKPEAQAAQETQGSGMAPIFWFGGFMLLVIVLYVIGNPS